VGKARLWTKDFILFTLANLFGGLHFYLLITLMAVYAIEQFQASQSQAGLASGIFIIGAVFARLIAGKYTEVIGRKRLLYGSLILNVLFMLLYFTAGDITLLLFVRFLHGVAFGCANTVLATAVMDLIPAQRRGEGTGYFSLAGTCGTAIGPFLGIYIANKYNYDMVFAVSVGFSLAGLFIMLFCKIPQAQLTREQLMRMKKGLRPSDFFEINALPITFVMIIMGIGYSGIVSFINPYAMEIGLENEARYFFIVFAAFLIFARPFAGRLLDRKGDNIVMYPGIFIFSLSLLVASLAQNGFTLLAAAALTALGYGTLMSSALTIAVKHSPRHRVGLATSTFFVCLDSGLGIGPYLLGLLIPYVHFRGMYLILAVLVLMSVFVYYSLHGRKAAAEMRRKPIRAQSAAKG